MFTKTLAIALFSLAVIAPQTQAASLEQGLIEAIEHNKTTEDRSTLYGAAIRAYKAQGYINPKPNVRADYVDYYLLNKPATFMGHDLKVIEEEYMDVYVGCCVSPGLGLSLGVRGSLTSLKAFAAENGCKVEENIDLYADLTNLGLKLRPMRGRFASLSCRERDLEQ